MYDQNQNNGDAPFYPGNNVEDTAAALTSSIEGMPDPVESIIADQPPKKGMSVLLKAMIGCGVVILGLGAAAVFMAPQQKAPVKKPFPSETSAPAKGMSMPGANAPVEEKKSESLPSPFPDAKPVEPVAEVKTSVPEAAPPALNLGDAKPLPSPAPQVAAEEKKVETPKEIAPVPVNIEPVAPVAPVVPMVDNVKTADVAKSGEACEPKAKPAAKAPTSTKKAPAKRVQKSATDENQGSSAAASEDESRYWKKVF